MRYLLLATVIICGCGQSEPTPAIPPELKRIGDGIEKAKAAEQSVLDSIVADKEGVLFPKAAEAVLQSSRESIGNTAADNATITPQVVEDFGDKKWVVTGTYSGPDRSGKIFSSQWEVTFQVFAGRLQTMQVKLGRMKYD